MHVAWPQRVYSLAHVEIPFAPDDQVYGTVNGRSGTYDGLALGALRPRGEIRFLVVPLSKLMRLRHNPFYAYVEQRIIEEIDKVP